MAQNENTEPLKGKEFRVRIRPDIAKKMIGVMLDDLPEDNNLRRLQIFDAREIAYGLPDNDPDKNKLLEQIRKETLKALLLKGKVMAERMPADTPGNRELLEYIDVQLRHM